MLSSVYHVFYGYVTELGNFWILKPAYIINNNESTKKYHGATMLFLDTKYGLFDVWGIQCK